MAADAFHELRIYSVEPGRTADMLDRVQGPLKVLFGRHGIRVQGDWTAAAGPGCPAYIYLMRWESWAQRETAWGGFYADPQWHDVRTRTNRGTELVERYELHFLREAAPWVAAPQHITCRELVVARCNVGASRAAHELMCADIPAALAPSGGVLLGAFEFITGVDLPRFALWVGWRDFASRQQARDALAIKPLGRADRWMLVPATQGPQRSADT